MKPILSFGIMADCQYADKDDEDFVVSGTHHMYHNRYRQSADKLRQAVETFNDFDLAFVVHLGDFVDRGIEEANGIIETIRELKAPFWHVLGNHDFAGSEDDHTRLYKKYGIENSYYAKQINGYRFIILDTNEVSIIKHPEGTMGWNMGKKMIQEAHEAGMLQAYDWNGGIGAEQQEWLEVQLNEAKAANEKVILFAHHPVFPPGVLNALNDEQIMCLIEKYPNVIAYINGHNHLGAFGYRKNVPYLTVPGMLQTETNAYGIVTVYENKIDVNGYGRIQDMTIEIDVQ